MRARKGVNVLGLGLVGGGGGGKRTKEPEIKDARKGENQKKGSKALQRPPEKGDPIFLVMSGPSAKPSKKSVGTKKRVGRNEREEIRHRGPHAVAKEDYAPNSKNE